MYGAYACANMYMPVVRLNAAPQPLALHEIDLPEIDLLLQIDLPEIDLPQQDIGRVYQFVLLCMYSSRSRYVNIRAVVSVFVQGVCVIDSMRFCGVLLTPSCMYVCMHACMSAESAIHTWRPCFPFLSRT